VEVDLNTRSAAGKTKIYKRSLIADLFSFSSESGVSEEVKHKATVGFLGGKGIICQSRSLFIRSRAIYSSSTPFLC
jgi:hypothetical protein